MLEKFVKAYLTKLTFVISYHYINLYFWTNNTLGMSAIYVLLSISIVVAVVFFVAFIISVKKGQYDDSYTPSIRMLFEDELVKDKQDKNSN